MEVAISHKFESGIDVGSIPGIIPEFYEITACNQANYRYFHDWQELLPEQKAKIVSHYLLNVTIDSHKSDAEQTEMERRMRKGKH